MSRVPLNVVLHTAVPAPCPTRTLGSAAPAAPTEALAAATVRTAALEAAAKRSDAERARLHTQLEEAQVTLLTTLCARLQTQPGIFAARALLRRLPGDLARCSYIACAARGSAGVLENVQTLGHGPCNAPPSH